MTAKAAPKLKRTTFQTNRLLEYFTEQQLKMQIARNVEDWPLALTKELIDNALDACESVPIAPQIVVTLDAGTITVTDNGNGLPKNTLKRSTDYAITVSDKAHYVSPTRGQLGNALKCVWAAPFVYNGGQASIDVQTPTYAVRVSVWVDAISQSPEIDLIPLDLPPVKKGTFVKIEWNREASYKMADGDGFYKEGDPGGGIYGRILNLLQSYATFNPHAGFRLCRDGETVLISEPLASQWDKWMPTDLTSSHWYSVEELSRLIAAHVTHGHGDKTVREFVASSFRGLTGSTKPQLVLQRAGLTGRCLNDFVSNKEIDQSLVQKLLKEMCAESKPVKAIKLGLIGEETLKKRMVEIDGVTGHIEYARTLINDPVRPMVVEMAFGLRPEDRGKRRIRFGLNFAPTLEVPHAQLQEWLQYDSMADPHDPVCLTVHIACPRFPFADRSKSRLTQAEDDSDEATENEDEDSIDE